MSLLIALSPWGSYDPTDWTAHRKLSIPAIVAGNMREVVPFCGFCWRLGRGVGSNQTGKVRILESLGRLHALGMANRPVIHQLLLDSESETKK